VFSTIVPLDKSWYELSIAFGAWRLNPITGSAVIMCGVGFYVIMHNVLSNRRPNLFKSPIRISIFVIFCLIVINGFLRENPPHLIYNDLLAFSVFFLYFLDFHNYWSYIDKMLTIHAVVNIIVTFLYILTHQFNDRADFYFTQARYIFNGFYFWPYFWFTWLARRRWQKYLILTMVFFSLYGAIVSETRSSIISWLIFFLLGIRFFLMRTRISGKGLDIFLMLILMVLVSSYIFPSINIKLKTTLERHQLIIQNQDKYGAFGMTGRVEEMIAFLAQMSLTELIIGRGAGGHWYRAVLYDMTKESDILANLQEPDLHSPYGTIILKGGLILLFFYTFIVLHLSLKSLKANSLVAKSLAWICITTLVLWIGGGIPWSYYPAGFFWVVSLSILRHQPLKNRITPIPG